MKIILLRRLTAFAIAAFVYAGFGFLVAFVYDANRGNRFQIEIPDFSSAHPEQIEAFLRSPDAGRIVLSANELNVFVRELYFQEREKFAEIASEGQLTRAMVHMPSIALSGDEVRVGVPVSFVFVVNSAQPEIAFYFEMVDNALVLRRASLGNARIPNFFANAVWTRMSVDYKNISTINDRAAKLSLLTEIKIEDGNLVLTR